jgi:hypothetical protein
MSDIIKTFYFLEFTNFRTKLDYLSLTSFSRKVLHSGRRLALTTNNI